MRKNVVPICLGVSLVVIIALAIYVRNLESKNQSLTDQLAAAKIAGNNLPGTLTAQDKLVRYSNKKYQFTMTVAKDLKTEKLENGLKFGTKLTGYTPDKDVNDGLATATAAEGFFPPRDAPGPATGSAEKVAINGLTFTKETYLSPAIATTKLKMVNYTFYGVGYAYRMHFEASQANTQLWEKFEAAAKSFQLAQ